MHWIKGILAIQINKLANRILNMEGSLRWGTFLIHMNNALRLKI